MHKKEGDKSSLIAALVLVVLCLLAEAQVDFLVDLL